MVSLLIAVGWKCIMVSYRNRRLHLGRRGSQGGAYPRACETVGQFHPLGLLGQRALCQTCLFWGLSSGYRMVLHSKTTRAVCLVARYLIPVGYIEQSIIVPRKLLFGAMPLPIYAVDDVLRHNGRSMQGLSE
jgi:hypothetical protein